MSNPNALVISTGKLIFMAMLVSENKADSRRLYK